VRLVLLGVAAWFAGLLSYVGALAIFYHQSLSPGDFPSVAVSSLIAFAICYYACYLPVLRGLRNLLHGTRPAWVFPVVAALVGLLPTALIARFWSGSFQAILSPEAGLFYVLFATVGLVLGLGFPYLDENAPLRPPE
jgi:hypothetical protein